MKRLFFLLFLGFLTHSFTQDVPKNGVEDTDPTIYAFKHAKIYASSDKIIEDGILLVQYGRILSCGANFLTIVPKNAVEINCEGMEIYPSFVEICSDYGVDKAPIKKTSRQQQLHSLKGEQYYWNQAMNSEFQPTHNFQYDFKEKKELIQHGFGVINVHRKDGISRGSSMAITLDQNEKSFVIIEKSGTFYSFSKGSSKQSYPTSQMGAIALLKQFFYDLEWYRNQEGIKGNLTLNAEIENEKLPKIFVVNNKLEALRVAKLGKELGLSFIIRSGGDEYESLSEIKASGLKYIIPMNFPDPMDVSDPYDQRFVSLEELKNWHESPSNAYYLNLAGVPFALTTENTKLKDLKSSFASMIKRGLPLNILVQKLTQTPAEFLGISDQVGTLETGKFANFIITEPHYFERPESRILENWVTGKRHQLNKLVDNELAGEYDMNLNGKIYPIEFIKKGEKYKAELQYIAEVADSLGGTKKDTIKAKVDVDYTGKILSFMLPIKDGHFNGVVACNGSFYSHLGVAEGNASYNSGNWFKWSLIRSTKAKDKKKPFQLESDTLDYKKAIRFPNMEYGFDSLPEQRSYFIKNATIWTNEDAHVLKNANLLIQNGKITFVGNNTVGLPMDVVMIDAKGKYVTSGIVDEHSHIAISRGVNEAGQNNSAEVTIEDVVNPEDINIYRQLAGGVTTAQLLHGSANPIGGRSALIKLKWGFPAQDYLIPNADGFIKFALGENVKQSNSGGNNTVRYPQTRMGVEQVYIDAFNRALEYKKKWEDYNNLPKKQHNDAHKPRRDLELEMMLDILEKKRFVTCHSYIQSEINMLMHVADTFNFNINTFTHILEGYKLADKMKAHGVGGSTFSDWWAYKYEVKDAIPYNAAILHEQGVVVAINSDDAEMGRRLNQEAAKTVKYGGMTEQDAWKMVTLNPAKLLHLDDRIGSIKVGKDADIVIWSDNPLSINAQVEQTFVDGYLLYDKDTDAQLRTRNNEEKSSIILKMIEAASKKENLKKPARKKSHLYHCNTIEE
ncbi:MAG: amidohydrolase family protein [Crocinitomicaceae bacterium]|nr:amidohydrolase family protein [Crocinitomicaceae bacterium]